MNHCNLLYVANMHDSLLGWQPGQWPTAVLCAHAHAARGQGNCHGVHNYYRDFPVGCPT